MVDRVMWTAGKFVDIVSNLDGEAVVKVTG